MTTRADLRFHNLHQHGLLLLANAWDAGSARIVQHLGAQAVATSSAAVAWSHGYADGEQLPRHLLLHTITTIARVLSVPLSIDIESGYSDDPERVADLVAAVIDAGAVGINIEDGRADCELLCRKIEAIRRRAISKDVNLFINARTDVYLKQLVPAEQRLAETLARASRYHAAGANGLFAAGVTDAGEIAAIASATPLSLNVLALPGVPSTDQLLQLGVRRLSAGSGIAEAMHAAVRAMARQFLTDGQLSDARYGVWSYGDLNNLMNTSN